MSQKPDIVCPELKRHLISRLEYTIGPFKIGILKCLVFRTPLYFSLEVFGVEWLEPLKVKLLSKLKLFINLLVLII